MRQICSKLEDNQLWKADIQVAEPKSAEHYVVLFIDKYLRIQCNPLSNQ